MKNLICLIISLCWMITFCFSNPTQLVPQYPFNLDSAGKAIEGHVYPPAKAGSKIHVTPLEGKTFLEQGTKVAYLRLVIRSGNLLTGLEQFSVVGTDAFKVDKHGYLVINNTDTLDHDKGIEFYIVMYKDNNILSNPVPFVVRLEKYNQTTEILPHYPFFLDSAGHAIEGYVESSAEVGSKVHVTPLKGKTFMEEGDIVKYLRLVIREGTERLTGLEYFLVVGSESAEAFKVDKDGYLVVNSTETFDHDTGMEFYVVMIMDNDILSNPVPFVIQVAKHVTEEHFEYNQTAAVFAGVLVCLIVAFALLIPFVVRAKRRAKHGKPIFKLGSHPSALDKQMSKEKGSQTNLAVHMVESQSAQPHPHIFRHMTEGDFYDNRGFRLEEEVEREKNELSKDLLAIASHVDDIDEATNVINFRKKHSSDSDSGMSSDAKNDKGKGILRNGKQQKISSIEMENSQDQSVQNNSSNEVTSHL